MKNALSLFLIFAFGLTLNAQAGYYGGYLSISTSGASAQSLSIEATAIVYAKGTGLFSDSLTIYWGDGSAEQLPLLSDELLENGTRQLQYMSTHTYPAESMYTLTAEICCLSEDITNIEEPAQQPLRLQTSYHILNPQFQGINRTPQFLQPGYDIAATANSFNYNLNAFDADNDSIGYQLYPQAFSDLGYQLPSELDSGGSAIFTIDTNTGQLIWETPSIPVQKYLVPIIITSFRDGFPVDSTLFLFTIETVDLTSSTELTLAEESIRVFPNPTTELINLKGIHKQAYIELVSPNGQLLQSWNIRQDSILQLMQPPGLYILHILIDNEHKAVPVLLQQK